MDNLYNNENNEHSDLIRDLKSLPKINAPENFEFNLMTRIQNKNFGLEPGEKPKFSLFKFFAPSAAVVTVIILFFVFYPKGDQIQNQIAVQKSVGDTQNVLTSTNEKRGEQVENKFVAKISSSPTSLKKSISEFSPSVSQSKIPPRISSQRAISVDDYISGAKTSENNLQGGSTVNGGDLPITNSFLIEKKTDRETLEKYRDSLKKAQHIADSLKNARK